VAVNWTLEPDAYDAWLGAFATDPLPTVVTVSVYWFWVKAAVIVPAPLIVAVVDAEDAEAITIEPVADQDENV
jgi:hypothetical protein